MFLESVIVLYLKNYVNKLKAELVNRFLKPKNYLLLQLGYSQKVKLGFHFTMMCESYWCNFLEGIFFLNSLYFS